MYGSLCQRATAYTFMAVAASRSNCLESLQWLPLVAERSPEHGCGCIRHLVSVAFTAEMEVNTVHWRWDRALALERSGPNPQTLAAISFAVGNVVKVLPRTAGRLYALFAQLQRQVRGCDRTSRST